MGETRLRFKLRFAFRLNPQRGRLNGCSFDENKAIRNLQLGNVPPDILPRQPVYASKPPFFLARGPWHRGPGSRGILVRPSNWIQTQTANSTFKLGGLYHRSQVGGYQVEPQPPPKKIDYRGIRAKIGRNPIRKMIHAKNANRSSKLENSSLRLPLFRPI